MTENRSSAGAPDALAWHLPPEWMLVVGADESAWQATRVLYAEFLNVRLARDPERLADLLARGRPAVAIVDLDAPFGEAALQALVARGTPVILYGADPAALARQSARTPNLIEKPFSDRAISRFVDSIIGRR